MIYIIRYSDTVEKKDLPKLSSSVRSHIEAAIEAKLATNPLKFGKPLRYDLKGRRALRVGNHRVLYKIIGNEVHIFAIDHRRDVY